MLFYDTSKSKNENNNVEVSSSSTGNEQKNLAHRAQNDMHVMECEPNYGVAQTEDSVQEIRDEHLSASSKDPSASFVNHKTIHETSEKTGRIEKSALLDIDPDDDDIQNYKKIDPWNDYFQDAQTKPHIAEESKHKRQKLSSDNTSSSQLTLDDILNKLKIDEICKDSKLSEKLKELVATYQDVFAVNVGKTPAKISPFKIEIDENKWSKIKLERYPRPQTIARQIAIKNWIHKAIADGVIRPSTASIFSRVLLTDPKT
jgi:hypothetical protein